VSVCVSHFYIFSYWKNHIVATRGAQIGEQEGMDSGNNNNNNNKRSPTEKEKEEIGHAPGSLKRIEHASDAE